MEGHRAACDEQHNEKRRGSLSRLGQVRLPLHVERCERLRAFGGRRSRSLCDERKDDDDDDDDDGAEEKEDERHESDACELEPNVAVGVLLAEEVAVKEVVAMAHFKHVRSIGPKYLLPVQKEHQVLHKRQREANDIESELRVEDAIAHAPQAHDDQHDYLKRGRVSEERSEIYRVLRLLLNL